MASFAPLALSLNASEWGPTSLPPHLLDISYAPFSKSERLGYLSNFLEGGSGNRGQGPKGAVDLPVRA